MKKPEHNGEQMKLIFIVDDAEWHNILLEKLLGDCGYEVKSFTSGYMLLENLKEEPPHLVISDIDMPDIDGLALCKMIKELPEGADVPVLFVSSLGEEKVRAQAEKNGAIGFIQKPFAKQPLLEVLAQKL